MAGLDGVLPLSLYLLLKPCMDFSPSQERGSPRRYKIPSRDEPKEEAKNVEFGEPGPVNRKPLDGVNSLVHVTGCGLTRSEGTLTLTSPPHFSSQTSKRSLQARHCSPSVMLSEN
ncbi:hypothetical protein J6590_015192 [Homalodisca vitripennis]|nr:hypothetical protein J6590_015192 [Homalodisca vitripennis]